MRVHSTSPAGFTLVELMVSIGIFLVMTALLVAKYGNFNQSVLLTNLAYDVALTLRTAQTYGVGVKGTDQGGTISQFQSAYGVDFCASATGCLASGVTTDNSHIVLFADSNGNHVFDGSTDVVLNTYAIKRGAIISQICISPTDCNAAGNLRNSVDITFLRPNPDATIIGDDISNSPHLSYVKISIKGTDGSLRYVAVGLTGQISVVSQ